VHPKSCPLFASALVALIVIAWTFPACSKTIDQTIDDATITAAVKTALLNDPQVGGMKIDVDTANGVVTLSGIVTSQPDAEHAMALARRAPGVKDVQSTLRVNPPA
jgi:hyperosmotically inducible periplasmic protein